MAYFFKKFMEEAEAARISKEDTRKEKSTERKNNRNFYSFFKILPVHIYRMIPHKAKQKMTKDLQN